MGCNGRQKSTRSGRKSRHSPRPLPDGSTPLAAPNHLSPEIDPTNLTLDLNPNPNPNPSPHSLHPSLCPADLDAFGYGFGTEDELEELLLKHLDAAYKEALSRLVGAGYDEPLALRALLCNGHCCGSLDVLSNILDNAMAYLKPPPSQDPASPAGATCNLWPAPSSAFSDLRRLQEYSLAGMILILRRHRPHLSRRDALWCLYVTGLHFTRACTVEVPDPATNFPPYIPYKLPPSMKPLLKRHALMLSARSANNSPDALPSQQKPDLQEPDVLDSIMRYLESMTINEDEKSAQAPPKPQDDHKKEMVLRVAAKVHELEAQVKEREEWAHSKAVQAARKLSADLKELKALRCEREESQRLKKGKQAADDSTMRRLSEMETALKRASGQVDRANALVKRLEMENKEIRAEMEASKLSASESDKDRVGRERKEKRLLKRLQAWDKQREKMREEIGDDKRKAFLLSKELSGFQEGHKEFEKKMKEETKAKERAISQAEEEARAKEAADAIMKRKHEELLEKIETDSHRYRDDIQRLEDELAQIKSSANPASKTGVAGQGLGGGPQKPRNGSFQCIGCTRNGVQVAFLPCAHEVLCYGCNEEHERSGKAGCPCCNARIEQRIRFYGPSS